MPARRSSVGLSIVDPAEEDLGPAMRACTILQRRFVVGIITNKFKDASRVVRIAGYSQNDATSRRMAYDLLRTPKIVRAIQEEAGRRLESLSALAVLTLEGNLRAKNLKARQQAADSILDRTGYPRRTERSVEVDDKRPVNRTYEQLLTLVAERLRGHNIEVPQLEAPDTIDGDFDVADDDGDARVQDERVRDTAKVDASSPMEDARSRKASK